jgi:hypothetical protein
MTNTLSTYNPIFYAQEALIALEKALGLAGRVYRGYDDEVTARTKGDTINIRVPGSFTAQDAPSAAQDITASSIDIKLDQHKEVKFALTDKELAYTSQRIIDEHIRPAAYALADKIDQSLAALVDDVPYFIDFTNPAAVADITNARRVMFDNKVNLEDEAMLHFMVSGVIEKELLDLQAFSQFQGSGQAGVDTQLRGHIGRRYGFNFFANQNVPSRTSQTIADALGAVNNGPGYAAGIKTMAVNGLTISLTPALKKGDIMQVTGHAQQYVVTADANTDGAGATTVSFYGSPNVQGGGLEAAVVNAQVVTFVPAGGSGTTKVNSMAFHRNAFALGLARLPDFMDGEGVKVFSTPIDPKSGLSVRARTWADPNNSKYFVALDALFGIKTLDGNKAVRGRD